MLNTLKQTTLPLIPEFVHGCDGVIYSLEVINGMNSATFSWWVKLPKKWQELEAVLQVFFGEKGVPDIIETTEK
jgi:hypothetical protein